MREECLYLAGLTESYNRRTYVPKGPDSDYYADNPAPADNAGFYHNFSALAGYSVNGEGVADWCIRDIRRLIDSENDAQNPIPPELEDEILHALEQIKAKFKEIAPLSLRAEQAWERMVDEHL